MRKALRWLGYIVAGIVVLILVGVGWIWFASSQAFNKAYAASPERLAAPTPAQLADAPRQARLLGCHACHGEGLRGDMMFDEPHVATVWAPNITDIAARASDQQLAQGIRKGVGIDGRGLWIMPSAVFSRLSDGEVAALIAHIRALPRHEGTTPPISMGIFGRLGIAQGDFRAAPEMIEDYRVRQPFDVGPEHAAGRRLASITCAECHGPDLAGGNAGPDVTPGLSVAGAYDLNQFTTLMRSGRPPSGRDLGLMTRVARANYSHLTDDEIAQLFNYLRARAQRVQDPPPLES